MYIHTYTNVTCTMRRHLLIAFDREVVASSHIMSIFVALYVILSVWWRSSVTTQRQICVLPIALEFRAGLLCANCGTVAMQQMPALCYVVTTKLSINAYHLLYLKVILTYNISNSHFMYIIHDGRFCISASDFQVSTNNTNMIVAMSVHIQIFTF